MSLPPGLNLATSRKNAPAGTRRWMSQEVVDALRRFDVAHRRGVIVIGVGGMVDASVVVMSRSSS